MDEKFIVEFPSGFFSESEIAEITTAANSVCPTVFNQKDKYILAAFDDIISVVNVYITPDFWTQLFAGLSVVAATQGLRSVLGIFKKIMQSKKHFKSTAERMIEQKPTIGIKGPNINIVLPTDISDEKFYYCIDKAFESVKDAAPLTQSEETITFYDDNTGNIFTYTIKEYYWKKVMPHQDHESVEF